MQLNKPGYQELWDSDSGAETDVHCAGLRGTDCDQLFSRPPPAVSNQHAATRTMCHQVPQRHTLGSRGVQLSQATCDRSRSVTELFRVAGNAEAFILRTFDLQGLPSLLVNSHRHFGRAQCLHIRCPDIRGPDDTVSCPRRLESSSTPLR